MADYVIIGGGSSGGVIASRLSEDPDVTVCLLEAGGPGTSPLVSTPGAFAALIQDYRINTLNWRFNTDPSKALNDRREQLKAGITASTAKRRAKQSQWQTASNGRYPPLETATSRSA